jgi:hypothetical protein
MRISVLRHCRAILAALTDPPAEHTGEKRYEPTRKNAAEREIA